MFRYITSIIICCFVSTCFAQKVTRAETKKVLFRTNRVIYTSYDALKKTKNIRGDLSRAYAHQKLAVTYFRKGLFNKSVFHSLYSRKEAEKTIAYNRGLKPDEAVLDAKENAFYTSLPSEKILVQELKASRITLLEEAELIKLAPRINIE